MGKKWRDCDSLTAGTYESKPELWESGEEFLERFPDDVEIVDRAARADPAERDGVAPVV